MKITDIQSPDQIKSMSTKQLQELADDIRMLLDKCPPVLEI